MSILKTLMKIMNNVSNHRPAGLCPEKRGLSENLQYENGEPC